MATRPRIVILGAGNVATHLALALAHKADIRQIYNHKIENAEILASRIGAEPIDSIDSLDENSDIYIISVKDDAIAPLASELRRFKKGVWVHTSGSVPADALDGVGADHGVLYPLQTFSKEIDVDMSEVPFFIEASSDDAASTIEATARLVSQNIYFADSELRKRLHVAAVFACNFPNYLWTMADALLKKDGLDLRVFKSLIMATIDKALTISPEKGQTGPARRGDKAVISSHESMLSGETAELYRVLSDVIYNHYHNSDKNE